MLLVDRGTDGAKTPPPMFSNQETVLVGKLMEVVTMSRSPS